MVNHQKLRNWVDVDKIYWPKLSKNPNAIHLLEKNLDKIDWNMLSSNPNAIHLLEKNLDKIDWVVLSSNPNAIHLLEKNLHKIDWEYLALNPAIFEYDYDSMYTRCNIYKEELIANRLHPRNFSKFKEWGEEELDFDLDFDLVS